MCHSFKTFEEKVVHVRKRFPNQIAHQLLFRRLSSQGTRGSMLGKLEEEVEKPSACPLDTGKHLVFTVQTRGVTVCCKGFV